MTKTAQLITTRGTQAIRLPREFRFAGKTVTLRRTAKGVLISAPAAAEDLEARRERFIALAGSCPDLPDVPAHSTPDSPRDW